ncbi:MAG: hypothetical protein P4L50_09115 [Anaerolineaceae bacterium]|nr:hypothetical protein [Anaerolineaceae bacterium]
MNRKWISAILLPVLGMIITLAFAYGCSRLNQMLQAPDSRAFQLYLVLPWTYALTSLLSGGAMIILFWGIMTRLARSKWTGWIFLIVGILLILIPLVPLFLYVSFGITSIYWDLPAFFIDTPFGSPLYFTELGIAFIGLLILILPRSRSTGQK